MNCGDRDVKEGEMSQWKRRISTTSSEGERLMLEALVESSRGGRRTMFQYVSMLSVVALPVIAVIVLISYTLHNSHAERASQQAAEHQFQVFSGVVALVASMRAERGFTTSVVILEGKDAVANEVMFKQRSHTDYILLSLPVWPDGLAIHDVPLTTSAQLGDMLNELRGRVSTLSISVVDVLEFYSDITQKFMFWLLVTNLSLLQGGPKNWTVFRVNNFATFNGRNACNMTEVSKFCIEKEYYLHVIAFE